MAGPLICTVVLIGLLSAWVATSGAGTLTRVRLEVTLAAVPMRAFTPKSADAIRDAGTYLTIRNLSDSPDELIAVRSPLSEHVTLYTRDGLAATGKAVSALTVPGHGTLTLSPLTDDVVLEDPAPFEGRGIRPADPGIPRRRADHHRRTRHRPGYPVNSPSPGSACTTDCRTLFSWTS